MPDRPLNETRTTEISRTVGPHAKVGLEPIPVAPRTPPPHVHIVTPTSSTRATVVDYKQPSRVTTPPSAFRQLVGFGLVMAAAIVGAISQASWSDFVKNCYTQTKVVIDNRGLTVGARTASATHPEWVETAASQEWVRWTVAGVLLLLGALGLKQNPILFLITAALAVITGYCTLALLGQFSLALPLLLGIGVAYLIHCAMQTMTFSLRGVIGFALVAVSCFGIIHGWFDWSTVDAKLGGYAQNFLTQWNIEVQWATVLLLTAIGVTLSRSRPLHFLIAVLLAVLAFYCVRQGFEKIVEFPQLARDGNIPTIAHESYRNVSLWRWVLGGELVLLSLVLLHLAAGAGGLTIVFGIAWIILALRVDSVVGRMQIARMFGTMVQTNVENTPKPEPLDSLGLPVEPGSGREPPLPIRANDQVHVHDTYGEIKIDEATAVVGGSLPIVWVYVTSILGGILVACGLRMSIERPILRQWIAMTLALGLGIGIGWLAVIWPRDPTQSWLSWLSSFGLHRYHVYCVVLVAMGAAAFTSIWALRESSMYYPWVRSAIAVVFAGTVLTLVTLGLLIRFGGFTPLPVWTYVVVAVGQSVLMWVLLMHLNLSPRRKPVSTM